MTSSTHQISTVAKSGPAPQRWLQRKCDCGKGAGLSGDCESCGPKKMLGLQPRLAIGRSNDALEREADDVARRVLAQPHPSSAGQGTVPLRPAAAPEGPATLRRLPSAPGPVATGLPASVDRTLASPGRPLEPTLRGDMEGRFGVDFSHVRVHTDAAAARSAREVSALAYAAGPHIAFANGQFAPGTAAGRELLAHELAHVVQQAAPGVTALMRKGFDSKVEVCQRVLTSRHFQVDKGGVRVVLAAQTPDTEVPNCRNFDFGVTLTRSKDWWLDKEIGTCESRTGGIRVFKFGNVPSGTYYLTFWRVFDHPYCCLEADVQVFDEALSGDGEGCTRAKDLSTMDIVHGALDLAGFIPALGAIPDGINASIYVLEGDWANAGLSAVAALPAVGDGIKAASMAGKAVIKVEAKTALKLGEEGLAAELKSLRAASESASAAKAEREAAQEIARLEREAAERAEKKATKPKASKPKDQPQEKPKEKPEETAQKKEKKPKKPKCTALEIEAQNLALHVFCNKPRSCSMQGDSCESATAKVAAGYGCVDGRVVLQQRCFHKGEPGYERHMQQIAQASAALRNCQAIMAAKCL